MICSHCQKEIVDGAIFCPECGAMVEASKQAETTTPTPDQDSTLIQTSDPVPASAPAPAVPMFVPVSAETAPVVQPANVLQPQTALPPLPAPGMTPPPAFSAPAGAFPYAYDESTYYHIDAKEEYDFEALRGISIALIVASVLCLVGILMPLPLAIVSLVKACNGLGERNPYEKTRLFNSSRLLILISIGILCLYVILFTLVFCFIPSLDFFSFPAQH